MQNQLLNTVIAVAALAGLSSCAVQKEMVATGGSRADGTVQMSFEYGLFEKPQIDGGKAKLAAAQRCSAWGYKDAEPFGGAMTKCEMVNGYGSCIQFLVTMSYQCTGTPPASR
jgi:hypothetical protein